VTLDGASAGYVRAERGGTWLAAPEARIDGETKYLPTINGLVSREAALDALVEAVRKYMPPAGGGRKP
jgi:hypothetical protein